MCKNIDDCDAKFTAIVQCSPDICNELKNRYQIAPFSPPEQFSRFKILIDIDGNSYSGRFNHLLKTGSVIFKISGVDDLCTLITEPWVDYVPVKMDLSDL